MSSRKGERYTTFQELVKNRDTIGVVNEEQLSDQWLVNKLHQHYYLINRRQQSAFWDLVLLRTIGFATFLRVCFPPSPEQSRFSLPREII